MAVKSEGLLVSPEILQNIPGGEIEGQKPGDFALDGKTRLSDEMTACCSAALDYRHAFQRIYSLSSGTPSLLANSLSARQPGLRRFRESP